MAGNTGFGDDPLAPGCYSQLLFSDEVSGLETDGCFGLTSSFSSDDNNNAPKMLCFGDYANAKHKPGLACMPDPPPKNINKKRNGSGTRSAGGCRGAPTGIQRNGKKAKSENSTGGHAKVVKKEKLGERITALQQLVSPFGKTDTASVLHEALGYIRFLHDQVQVLCSPYLQRSSPSSSDAPHSCVSLGDEIDSKNSSSSDLRSRGLCLVPVDLTLHVAESNGADLWSSAPMLNTVSPT
ncbi:transcription factor bHLH113 isoform X1 [Salvia miltiorrhiza]|uniref:transcription factor bHLH113 isoform X1 n=1 Tax=Salvia miltiorrhiza TaxID=226208 RepID=UPI0025AD15E8|nr:transcription factor bHLH113 isoform X1 [Salvia miltiorrhiza]